MPANSRPAFGLRLRPGLHVRVMHLVRWGGFETRPYHRRGHCRTHHAGRSDLIISMKHGWSGCVWLIRQRCRFVLGATSRSCRVVSYGKMPSPFCSIPLGMHRSVENAVPPIQHPVRDASLGSLAALGLNRRREERMRAEDCFWRPQGLFYCRKVRADRY